MIDAAAALTHQRHGQARGADRREQRLVDRRLPLGVGRAEDVGAAGLADVVDQDVDAAEPFDRARHDQLDAGGGRDVGLHRQHHARAARRGFDFHRGFGQPLFAARAQAHAAAFRHQRAGARQPETAARTGDDRYLVGESEIHPGVSPPGRRQVVQPPVEIVKRHLEGVLLDELALEAEQVGRDERDHRPLDRRPLRIRPLRALVVGGDELGLAPADDRRHASAGRSSGRCAASTDRRRTPIAPSRAVRRAVRRCTPRCADGRCRRRPARAPDTPAAP